jgi:hypothetical protein
MGNLLWDRVTAERDEDPPERAFTAHDPYEMNPPEPMQIFTRLGLLLMIALAFGLVAELLVQLPPH